MKKKTKVLIIVIVTAVLLVTGVVLAVLKSQGAFSKGNDYLYSVEQTLALTESPIEGKTVVFLGSSVTYGSAAKGESFVDYLERHDNIHAVKEAVSGTTLVDSGKKSYISRLKKLDTSMQVDAFICQLSTNDATRNKPLGEIGDTYNLDSFDTSTVAGSIEYIICYAQETWHCPVAFYTGTKYNSKRYGEMVELLKQIANKWNITVINLWEDPDMNRVTKKDYRLYMVNGIHPSRAGYKIWWMPKFEEYLFSALMNRAEAQESA